MTRTPNPIAFPNQKFDGDVSSQLKEHGAPLVDGVPKGRNASGRSWKVRAQKRASSLITKCSANNRSTSWNVKIAQRKARLAALKREKEMKEEKRQAILAKKERRLENERRRAENEFKNASRSAQSLNLKNVDNTMKAMSKKQLRAIKKTRMNSRTGVVEYVSAYAK